MMLKISVETSNTILYLVTAVQGKNICILYMFGGKKMDSTTKEMVLTAYDDTYADACAQGHDHDTAHKEGVTAAAMCLAAVAGVQDDEARKQVIALNLGKSED